MNIFDELKTGICELERAGECEQGINCIFHGICEKIEEAEAAAKAAIEKMKDKYEGGQYGEGYNKALEDIKKELFGGE